MSRDVAHEPRSQEELAQIVARAIATETPLYTAGGNTSVSYGLPAKKQGEQLSVTKLNSVIDYPARDLTVTVEAGVTMQGLADLLAKEGQELPIDVPQADRATVGGVVATNWNGPRRLGCGSVRDYVIGITAVDGRGEIFSGGGRVVKNVAGYDFCKLLTGSMGTLAVMTQLTFKLRPKCASRVCLLAVLSSLDQAEAALSAVAKSSVRPAAVELLAGPAWSQWSSVGVLVVLEGTKPEVAWMSERLTADWQAAGVAAVTNLHAAPELWSQVVEFSAGEAPLVLKASLTPSGVSPFAAAIRKTDPDASVLAHAASGVVFARFAALPSEGVSKAILNTLQPLAASFQGHVQVIAAGAGVEQTRQVVWGSQDAAGNVMAAVKQQFDPRNILNPGRFIFP